MNYEKIWEKVLGSDEKIEYEFSIGDRYLKVIFVFFTVALVFFFFTVDKYSSTMLFSLVCFYSFFYAPAANAYALTNKRILIHTGWLSTNLVSVEYSRITDIVVGEQFFEKLIMHSGYLRVNTAGTSSQEIILNHIENPYEVKKKIDNQKDKSK